MPVRITDLCHELYRETCHACNYQTSDQMAFKIKTGNGWRTIDSPYDPHGEINRLIGTKFQPDVKAIALGAGSGYLIPALLRRGVSCMLVITGSRTLARRNAEMPDCADASNDIHIIVAAELNARLLGYLEAFFSDTGPVQVIAHPREPGIYPRLFNPLAIMLENLQMPYRRSAQRSPRRVVLACSGQIIEPEVKKAFLEQGAEVEEINSYAGKTINAHHAWHLIHTHKPDMVFSTNNKSSDRLGLIPEACHQAGIPWATWFLDDPRFIVAPSEMAGTQERYAFCWDAAGMDACRQLGIRRAALLPLATDIAHFTPGYGRAELRDRIVYVGSPSFGNEQRYFAGMGEDPHVNRIAQIFESQIRQQRRIPAVEEITSVLHKIDTARRIPLQFVNRLPAFMLYRANLNYRIAAISAIAELRPIVYGDGWEGLLPDTVEIRGYIDYYRDLASIYRSDAVHLSFTHLQMRHYPNQRIFDVGACGRAVLGERLDGWSELFCSDQAELFFEDFDQLKQKAAWLAADRRRREQLGASLRGHILAHHTFAHRLERIFKIVYANIEGQCSQRMRQKDC